MNFIMQLQKEKYTKEIKILYVDNLIEEILEKMVDFISNHDTRNLTLIKVKKETKVYKFKYNNHIYYIKAYLHKKKKLKNYFRYKAFRNIKITKSLIESGIPVFTPYLSISYRNLPFPNNSLFITEEFEGINASDFLLENYGNLELKKRFIEKIAYIWSKLYKNGFIQGDPNLDNVMVRTNYNKEKGQKEEMDIVLVDVDSIRKWPLILDNMVIKNLAKFNSLTIRNLSKYNKTLISCEDRKFFLEEFLKHYKTIKNIDFFKEEIKKKTIEKLKKWNKENLINRNDFNI